MNPVALKARMIRIPVRVSSIIVSKRPIDACASFASLLSFFCTVAIPNAERGMMIRVNKVSWVEKKLQDFELSPYGYAQSALERKLQLLQGDRENPENKNFIKEIDLRIAKVKTRLDNLLDSYEKKIPLKLPRNDRTRDFRPDEGLVFDSENAVYILNKYLKENTKSYTVGDAFQKGPAQYVMLKTDTGVEKEININKLSEILSEVSYYY